MTFQIINPPVEPRFPWQCHTLAKRTSAVRLGDKTVAAIVEVTAGLYHCVVEPVNVRQRGFINLVCYGSFPAALEDVEATLLSAGYTPEMFN